MKNNNTQNSFIIYALGNIGDFIWETSAISLIKQTEKNCKLALIVFDSYIPLTDNSLQIDEFIKINKKIYCSKYKIISRSYKIFCLFKNYFKIKKYQNIVFLDQNKLWTLFAKHVYKIKNIIGPDKLWCGFDITNPDSKYYTHVVNLPKDSDKTHMILRYQMIIRNIFHTYNLALPVLPDTSFLKNKISDLLKPVAKYNIALCLMGTNYKKIWKQDYWKELIIKINSLQNNSNFFIIGSGKEQYILAENLSNSLPNINIKNYINKTSLLELKEFLKYMNSLISVDTGAAHLAAISNVPTITLHGTSIPEHSMPISSKAEPICLYKECSPCDDRVLTHKEVCKNNKCLKEITPDVVFEKVKGILQ